jgi:putative phosphoesterase
MVIGVMSDTHGNLRRMHRAANLLSQEFAAEVIIHLGDDYADASELETAGHTVWAVPGLWCPEYHSYRVPRARVEEVQGNSIAFAHAGRDIALVQSGADLLLTGHTHSARIALEDGAVCMNPGHLRRSRDRGEHASFGLVILSNGELTCSIHEADGRLRLLRKYKRGPAGRFIPAQ